MVQSVELLLDETTEDAVLDQWRALAVAGLPHAGRNPSPSNRPHVTAAVAAQLPGRLDDALAEAVGPLPLPVRLGGLVVFGGRRLVLSRVVVTSLPLLALHQRVDSVLEAVPGEVPDRPRTTRPGCWTPHVTLARGLSPEQLGRAVAQLDRVLELEAHVVAVRRWDGEARREWLLPGQVRADRGAGTPPR